MQLRDRKEKALYGVFFALSVLACLELVGQLRGLFLDVWHVLAAIVWPLVLSIIATYVLRPIVDAFEARGVPRTVSILVIYGALAILFAVVLVNIVPLLGEQVAHLARQLPLYVKEFDTFVDHLSFAARVLPNGVRIGLEKAVNGAETGLVGWLSGALVGVRSLVGSVVAAFVVPFLVFYLLKDYTLFTNLIVRLFPKRSRTTVSRILTGVDHSLGRYVRGQLLVMLLVGLATLAGLLIVRMPYALLLSSIAGLTNLIPYVGPFIGAAPALLMASGVSRLMVIKVLIVNLTVQQLEGNVFSPWIMGRTMNLHPLAILLAVMLAGEIGGITGLIFAVPLVATVKVIVDQIHSTRT